MTKGRCEDEEVYRLQLFITFGTETEVVVQVSNQEVIAVPQKLACRLTMFVQYLLGKTIGWKTYDFFAESVMSLRPK